MRTDTSDGFKTLLLPVLLTVALITALAIAACSSGSADEPTADEQVSAESREDGDSHDGADTHDDGDALEEGDDAAHQTPEEFVVTMNDDLTFGPNEVVVKAGEPVRLVIDNEGSTLHDFTVDEIPVTHMHHEGGSMDMDHMAGEGHDGYALHMALDGGDAGTLEFVPGESGEYVFHCTVPGHTEYGMHGTLVVRALE